MSTPLRMCVVCRQMKAKVELLRVAKKDGEFSVDISGKLPGRGAYICKKSECLARAIKSKALERAFSCKIEKEVYDALTEKLAEEKDAE